MSVQALLEIEQVLPTISTSTPKDRAPSAEADPVLNDTVRRANRP